VVDVSAIEYAFEWDEDVGDGDVAFEFSNDGEEMHEFALVSVGEDFDIDAVKEYAESDTSGEGQPPGVNDFAGFAIATPGLTANVPLEEPLAPGDYALLCFIPTEDGTPHVVLNMYSEFTVE
jgi:hypothetical protein